MSITLSVHSTKAYKKFLLPAVNNTEYSIVLNRETFGLQDDVEIGLEVIESQWYFRKSDQYDIKNAVTKEDYFQKGIQNTDILSLDYSGQEKLSIMVNETQSPFCVYEKYKITSDIINIGQENGNDIQYDIQNVISKQHAVIRRQGTEYILEDKSANGTFVNDERMTGSRVLSFGDCITMYGLSIVYLNGIIAVHAEEQNAKINTSKLQPCISGNIQRTQEEALPTKRVLFHRSPRQIYKMDKEVVDIEAPPQPKQENKRPLAMIIGPTLSMTFPMLLGCILTIVSSRSTGANRGIMMYSGIVTSVASAMIGTIWTLLNLRYEKNKVKDEELHRFDAYHQYLIQTANQIKEKYERNTENLRKMYVHAQVCSTYNENTTALWNRNGKHEDFLNHRVGIGDMDFQVKVNVPKKRFTMINDSLATKPEVIQENYQKLHQVPICIELMKHHVIGMVGGRDKKGAVSLMHNLVAQIATSNCYTDVKLAFIYDETQIDSREWEWIKWFPHTWSESKKVRYIAGNKAEAGDILYEITKVFRLRMEERGNSLGKQELYKPYYVLFVANKELLEGELINKYIFDSEHNYGLTTIFLEDSCENLPNECEYIIQNDMEFKGSYVVSDDLTERTAIEFDKVDISSLEKLARTLSYIEVKESETGGDIPASLTFFDMLGVQKPQMLNAKDNWRKNRTYESMKALVGQKAGGTNVYLDVHEKYHGPHGLVAGTTGSGKSETLQTYILSLAINYSPYDVGFLLIDYKGGGMANLFNGLPHIIGQISNLSGNQVRRAMVSIKSENKRRQRIFNEHGVNNINLYTRLYKNNEASIPVPHLFIVIDEFAELKREEPDFMRELISVAQVGRSLGVHLILATQKPNGTVDENIWSNSRFRLCLRVQDRQDSQDMLHRPDAAYLTQAGRCYMQVGNDELFELFQSGWSGAVYDEDNENIKADIARMVSDTGKAVLIGNRAKLKQKENNKLSKKKEKTQLDAVVEYLRKTALENGYTYKQQLWLPALPTVLYLKELPNDQEECAFTGTEWKRELDQEWKLEVAIGLYDDPVNQAQEPLRLSLSEGGNHIIAGTIVTGKSTFLQTLLYALTRKYTPEDLNIYIADYSAKMLSAFEGMPHVGGVIYEGETERADKLFNMLMTVLAQRKQLLKGGNYSQYVRVHGTQIPAIVVVIDNYTNFRGKTNNQYDEAMLQLAREGVSYGMFLIITGEGFGAMEIPTKLGENFRTVVCLEMNDKMRYADALHTMHLEVLPETNVKGRGIAKVGDEVLEFQTALAFEAADDFTRSEEIRKLSTCMRTAWKGKAAKPIPEIPQKPVWQEFSLLEDVSGMAKDDRHLPIGYNAKNAAIYGVDLSKTYCYLITGKARSGKTNLLRASIYSAQLRQGRIAVFDFKAELLHLAEQEQILYIDSDQKLFEYFKELMPDFIERNKKKKSLIQQSMTDDEIYMEMRQYKETYLFIADFADFVQHAAKPSPGVGNASAFIENLLDKGAMHNVYWFAVLQQESIPQLMGTKMYDYFIKYKYGMHLGGNVAAQRIFSFDFIPYNEQNKPLKAGIGMVPNPDEETRRVVIPLVKG